jgi:mono/diheme cytochrome c family protein
LRKRLIVYLILFVVSLAAVVFVGAAYFVSHGFSARNQPPAIEAFFADRLRLLAIPREAREAKNPITAAPEVLSEAMAHFADHCAFCHANDGSGNTPIAKGLYPKPPDMRLAATQNLTDGEIFYIIHNGVRLTGMPAFGEPGKESDDLDSWKLVHFIRRLPQLATEDVEKMKELNPKTPDEIKEEEQAQRFLQGQEVEPVQQGHEHHH